MLTTGEKDSVTASTLLDQYIVLLETAATELLPLKLKVVPLVPGFNLGDVYKSRPRCDSQYEKAEGDSTWDFHKPNAKMQGTFNQHQQEPFA